MIIGRVLGWLFVLAAAVVALRDIIGWLDTGTLAPLALGQLWYDVSPTSIEIAQPAIQRHVAPWIWDPVILDILLLWAAPVLAVPGLVLLWACRGKRRRLR
jgi:hypothetical protein